MIELFPHRLSLSTGIDMDVFTAGNPAHPAIIFLHGFPESHRTWRHQMAALSDRYFCIAPDQRGYARSDKPQGIAAYKVPVLVADVLALTVSEAAQLFANDREVIRALQPIVDVGLEYVRLGQPVPTLSGGEAQRLKLAGFLADAAKSASSSRQATARKGTLFLFDEPTTGLHFADIALLLKVLHQLRDAGNTIVVIEHNLDVIKTADWLIDMGPEGGSGGGTVVGVGTPETLAQNPASFTGRYLKRLLEK